MKVVAKFYCVKETKQPHWDSEKGFLYGYEFNAVTDGSEENGSFFAATPSGQIELQTVKSNLFEPGKDYYLTFEEA